MEIKVGIQHVNREIVVETTESAADVEQAFAEAVETDGVFTLTDEHGRKVLIPAVRSPTSTSARRTPAGSASAPSSTCDARAPRL